jgi:hypothetical protein
VLPRLLERRLGCTATVSDPQALVRALDSSARFRRDTGYGAIYHRGKVSYRELSPTNSIHVVIDGNRLSAHVDRISPLKRRADGSSRYSMARVVAHNVSGIREDVTRRISGRRPR